MARRLSITRWLLVIVVFMLIPTVDAGIDQEQEVTLARNRSEDTPWKFAAGEIGSDDHLTANWPEGSTGADILTSFIRNDGQINPAVGYYQHSTTGSMFITEGGALVYSLTDRRAKGKAVAFTEEFMAANEEPVVVGMDRAEVSLNFFRGSRPEDWKRSVPCFGRVQINDLYQNVSIQLISGKSSVEKLFIVDPGGDPEEIQVRLTGADSLSITVDGQLLVATPLGELVFSKPIAFQTAGGRRCPVAVEYTLDNSSHTYGFHVGEFDKSRALFIDPFYGSTYLGGSSTDVIKGLATDSEGNILVAGYSASIDLPTTNGAYDRSHENDYDIFVAKFDENLGRLLAATYYGGSGAESEYFLRLALDSSDNIYVAGCTTSNNLPMAGTAFDPSYNGGGSLFGDVIIAEFNPSLEQLLASTYLGGSGDDTATSIFIKGNGQVIICGISYSSNFPTTAGAFDTTHNGGADMFVSILSGNLQDLVSSTYIGGSNEDAARDVKADDRGEVYLACRTWSSDMPTTGGAYDRSFNGGGEYGSDAYFARLSPDLSSLAGATYLGGSNDDWGFALVLADGGIYASGFTRSADFPIAGSNVDGSYNGSADGYIVKFNNTLSSLLASTYIGGAGWDEPYSMAKDSNDSIYIAGSTGSSDFPVTEGAFDTTYNGGTYEYGGDVFVARVDKNLALQAATYIGGGGIDVGYDITTLKGSVVVAGQTVSHDFPCSNKTFDGSFNGSDDGFVCRIDNELSATWRNTDLENVSIKLKPLSPRVGGKVSCIGKVRNNGFISSPEAKLKVYLSQKDEISKRSVLLVEQDLPAIKSGKRMSIRMKNISVPQKVKPIGYYLISVIEFVESSQDVDPSNNLCISSKKYMFSK